MSITDTESRFNLWVDDVRPPWRFVRLGWIWAKTYQEAIEALSTGLVNAVSLDHDLEPDHYQVPEGDGSRIASDERTGYHIVMWMIENGVWPERIILHSVNPVGRERMAAAIRAAGHECEIEVGCALGGAR